jgi:protein-disulfide isomerase
MQETEIMKFNKLLYITLLTFLFSIPHLGAADTAKDQSNLLELKEDDHFLGDTKAKVVVIEYSSMSCPHCAEFHKRTFGLLKQNYINTNKILYIHRGIPTNHPSLLGSMLTACVGKDQYFDYVATLMDAQMLWAYRKDYKESLINIAKLGGLTDEAIKACFNNKENENALFEQGMNASQKLGFYVTPVFFINGKKHEGALSYLEMSKIIDDLLK